ncbi:MAG: ATP-binding cassette domain-containing protein, partial [Aestuariivirga sp.]
MSGSAPLLSFERIERVYGEGEGRIRALAGVDLTIERAEFTAIMGPSGSGKSTAMNILGCLDTPSRGTYRFSGADVTSLSRD